MSAANGNPTYEERPKYVPNPELPEVHPITVPYPPVDNPREQ